MKIEPRESSGVGFLSIVVIFVLVVLTVLGVLGFMSARADYKLSKKNGEYIKAYYKAEEEAGELLATIHQNYVLGEDISTDRYKTYTVPITDEQVLDVVILFSEEEDNGYQILEWHVKNNMEIEVGEPQFEDVIDR
ncbi:MAG: hypothetical protein ACRCTE_10625 [Cellulosilyticaceae bacterium]